MYVEVYSISEKCIWKCIVYLKSVSGRVQCIYKVYLEVYSVSEKCIWKCIVYLKSVSESVKCI